MSQNSGKQLNNWPLLAGLALLLYDYLLTLPTEIHIVWPRPKPWFILVRYLALSTNFTMVVLTFGTFGSQLFTLPEQMNMTSLHMVHHFPYTRSMLPADYTLAFYFTAILTLRVYALFNRNRVILGLLSLGGLGSFAIGAWLGSTADIAVSLPGSLCILSHVSCRRRVGGRMDLSIFGGVIQVGNPIYSESNNSLIAAVDVANILIYYFGDVNWLTHGKPFLVGSLAWLASALSAVLTARLILNMREVADTDGMAVGDVASEDADTVVWTNIDGTPMEHIRSHVRNRASWVYGNDLEVV
ncbi:hypothetical protein B0H14DRAFT_3588599 [Mycena olivaceomarginata]|nr:hypothetical protein B0H14DRAFT_3588599 [Mycena olivaceomarginata]